ncbi:uncharacterized protein LOC130804647 [Amaranthus tricolor]|uniref:uncharacterized protein LOC130804647 n=1 Tax=Amaranthus tricolor TaxID=29722 RepID=UPI00258B61A0|nr:uncharacterized protein LOC130804647 [Amaranthus tricolor]
MKHKTLPNPIPKPTQIKKMTRFNSTPIPLCFRPSSNTTLEYHHNQALINTTTSTPNLITCLYQTRLGIFSLTWSYSMFSRTFNLHLYPSPSLSTPPLSLSSPSFQVTLKPFMFWNKNGVKKLPPLSPSHSSIYVFWDLTNAKFGSGSAPEPVSGFYIVVVYEGEIVLLVGDMEKEAFLKTKGKKVAIFNETNDRKLQSLVIKREHVFGNRFYSTRIDFGGKSRLILIELNTSIEEDPRLVIRLDSKRVLQVKHLRWKFRGSERIEVDGYPIQLSWDVYNWLFEEDCATNNDDGYALFTFRFEKQVNKNEQDEEITQISCHGEGQNGYNDNKKGVIWSQDSCGLNYERKKIKKKLLVKTRSASSSSISSASSASSSILEWESVEENELKGPNGFSLLVYAWKN